MMKPKVNEYSIGYVQPERTKDDWKYVDEIINQIKIAEENFERIYDESKGKHLPKNSLKPSFKIKALTKSHVKVVCEHLFKENFRVVVLNNEIPLSGIEPNWKENNGISYILELVLQKEGNVSISVSEPNLYTAKVNCKIDELSEFLLDVFVEILIELVFIGHLSYQAIANNNHTKQLLSNLKITYCKNLGIPVKSDSIEKINGYFVPFSSLKRFKVSEKLYDITGLIVNWKQYLDWIVNGRPIVNIKRNQESKIQSIQVLEAEFLEDLPDKLFEILNKANIPISKKLIKELVLSKGLLSGKSYIYIQQVRSTSRKRNKKNKEESLLKLFGGAKTSIGKANIIEAKQESQLNHISNLIVSVPFKIINAN